jgi:23S rRNA (guanosine2251-2'-O)-methyltransferase
VVPQRRQALERLVLHATSLRIPVVEVEGGTLTSIAGFDGHQGIALVVEPRTYAGLDDVLARAVERGEPPFVLVMDSLEDPQNVGTLLRSAEAAGVHGVIFPTHHQAPLSPAAVKASAGAVEHLLLCPVDDLPGALSDLRIRGLRIAAAEADAPLTAEQADLRGPLAIIVGSEGQGLAPAVRRRADLAIRIPMRGTVASLNAAVAGSILLFAAVAQRPATSAAPALAGTGDGDPDASIAAAPDAPLTEAPSEPEAPSETGAPAKAAKRTQRPATKAKATKAETTKAKATKAEATKARAPKAKATKTEPSEPEATPAAPAAATADEAAPAPAPRRAATTKKAAKSDKPAKPVRAKESRAKTAVADHAEAGETDDLLPGGPTPD